MNGWPILAPRQRSLSGPQYIMHEADMNTAANAAMMFESQELAVLWTLHKDGAQRSVRMVTHAFGLELRLEQNGGLLYSHKDYDKLIEMARERNAAALEKGWTEPPQERG